MKKVFYPAKRKGCEFLSRKGEIVEVVRRVSADKAETLELDDDAYGCIIQFSDGQICEVYEDELESLAIVELLRNIKLRTFRSLISQMKRDAELVGLSFTASVTNTMPDLNWVVSEYGDDRYCRRDYFVHDFEVGEQAYIYVYETDIFSRLRIKYMIRRSDDPDKYDELVRNENVLLEGESVYGADTSAEFITDNDCYLVWFTDDVESVLFIEALSSIETMSLIKDNQLIGYFYMYPDGTEALIEEYTEDDIIQHLACGNSIGKEN